MLRQPKEHVLSMYSHCQQGPAKQLNKHLNVSWLGSTHGLAVHSPPVRPLRWFTARSWARPLHHEGTSLIWQISASDFLKLALEQGASPRLEQYCSYYPAGANPRLPY